MKKLRDKDIFDGQTVPRVIAKFAVPTILSQMVTLLYNLADTFFVGHTNDPAQVAALTLSFPLFMSLTMIGNLFGIGANSLISRSLGIGDKEKAENTSTFAFYGALAATVLLVSIMSIFISPILNVVGASTESVFVATKSYLTWTVIYGGLPTVATLMLGHFIRAEGNTKQASIGMVLGGVLNIVLDPIFIQGLGMGAAGAGIATFLSNIVSCIYLLTVVFKSTDTVIILNISKIKFIKGIIKEVILVGIPAAVIIILGSSANMVLTHYMSDYGEVSVAAFGVVQKVGTITIQITIGLTQGIMPLLGFSYGSGNMKRVKEINGWSFGILGVYSTLCIILIEIFARELMLSFIAEPETVETGIIFMRIWILCAVGMCFTNLFNCIFQAMGKWFQSLMLSVIRQAVLLIPLLIILNKCFGVYGLVLSQPIADTVALAIGIFMYIGILREQKLSEEL